MSSLVLGCPLPNSIGWWLTVLPPARKARDLGQTMHSRRWFPTFRIPQTIHRGETFTHSERTRNDY
jgi:hypothetical protein